MTKRFTYRAVCPDGYADTRNSDRVYTHAIVARCACEPWGYWLKHEWGVMTYCGRPDLAQKALGTWRKRTAFKDAQIVPVEIVKDRGTKGDDSQRTVMSD